MQKLTAQHVKRYKLFKNKRRFFFTVTDVNRLLIRFSLIVNKLSHL
jgi:hypothetical protein